MAGFNILDLLAGNTQPGGFSGQVLGNQTPNGLAALLQNAGSPAAMALNAPPPPPPQPPTAQPVSPMAPPQMSPAQAPQPMPGYRDMTFAPQPSPNAVPADQVPGAAASSTPTPWKKPGINWNRIIGALSDGLSVAGGGQPLWQENQQKIAGDARDQQNAIALLKAKAALEGPDKPALQKNYEYFISIGRPDLANSYLQSEGNPQTLGTDPETGKFGFVPKGGIPGGIAPASASPPPGYVWNGKRFKGTGNYQDPTNWEDAGGPSPVGSVGFR